MCHYFPWMPLAGVLWWLLITYKFLRKSFWMGEEWKNILLWNYCITFQMFNGWCFCYLHFNIGLNELVLTCWQRGNKVSLSTFKFQYHLSIEYGAMWVRIPLMVRSIRYNILCNKVCQRLATGDWFSPVSSTNKTDRHEKAEILLNNPECWIFHHFQRWKYKSNVPYRKKDNSNKL